MFGLVLRLALLVALPFILVFFVMPMPGLAPAWDFANAAGLLAAIILLLLFLYHGRPLPQPFFDGKFFMLLHRNMGYLALLFLLVHIGILLFNEPQLLDELLPSAPWFMLAGLLASLLLLALIPLSLQAVRHKVWGRHARFKHWHYWVSAAIVVLAAIHILGAGFYTGTFWKGLLWSALTAAALLWPKLSSPMPRHGPGNRRRRTAFLASRLSIGLWLSALVLAGLFALLANSDFPL
ncbi:hypothetical protein D3C84_216350 [compost metagenome]